MYAPDEADCSFSSTPYWPCRAKTPVLIPLGKSYLWISLKISRLNLTQKDQDSAIVRRSIGMIIGPELDVMRHGYSMASAYFLAGALRTSQVPEGN